MRRLAITVPLLSLCSCAHLMQVAQAVQEANIHPIAAEALEVAHDPRCDDQPTTLDAAMAKLTVPIIETRITKGKLTAAPRALFVPRGFSKWPDAKKLIKLRHELVHYCQYLIVPGFVQLWGWGNINESGKTPVSDFRWAFEARAYGVAEGGTDLRRFYDDYLFHDLDGEDYTVQTQRLWEEMRGK